MRLFVALDLPEDARDAVPRPPAPWRAVAPQNLHVTLVFVGERPFGHAAKVVAAVGRAVRPVGPLRVDPRQPRIEARRVLALPLADPTGACRELQAAVEREVVAEGILHASRRAWRPHLTLARLSRSAEAADTYLPAAELTFVPPAVTVYASTPAPGGSRYEVVARLPLEPVA